MKTYTITSEKKLPESQLEIAVEVAYDILAKHRVSALKKISSNVSIPGFRVGHVPEHIVVQKFGELAVLEEAAQGTIGDALSEIAKEKNISIVGEPHVSISKIAPGNPLAFTITISVIPDVALPDYKKIAADINAKKPEEICVSEKEIMDFIENVRKGYAHSTAPAHTHEDGKEHVHDLPELTDEFVKKLGDFKTVEDLKNKVKENLLLEKTQKAREKKRLLIAEAVLKETPIEVPKALIESELAKLLARFHDDISRMGMTPEDYLKNSKKTEEDIRKEWRPDAEKRGKLQLVWNAISEKEKIVAPLEAIEEEVKHLLEHYKDADKDRTRAYVTMMMTNEKVFDFLEEQK